LVKNKQTNKKKNEQAKWGKKKLQNYSPRLGTVIFEAFSSRKRDSRRYTTKKKNKKKKKKPKNFKTKNFQNKKIFQKKKKIRKII